MNPPATHVDALEPWLPESVQWRRLSPRMLVVEELRVLTSTAIGLIIFLGVGLVFNPRIGWIGAGAVLALGVFRAVLVVRAVRAWGYAEREDDLLVRHGVLVRRLSIVPYARMQFVDVTAGPLERTFGLSTVILHTAAAASDAAVPGLAAPEAARLRDRLSALGEARAEGL
ncbi:MAG TPA: PH domain-containing protein [Micromonosporaceae bacterium]|nr:PH domain-containing protein [Micromonosporaceae bacterium]